MRRRRYVLALLSGLLLAGAAVVLKFGHDPRPLRKEGLLARVVAPGARKSIGSMVAAIGQPPSRVTHYDAPFHGADYEWLVVGGSIKYQVDYDADYRVVLFESLNDYKPSLLERAMLWWYGD